MNYETDNKTYLTQIIPKKYEYLTKTNKVTFNGKPLKTDLLINLINEFMINYFFSKQDEIDKEIKMNVWSIILKKKYGAFYNYYMEYLIDKNFIVLETDYYRNKKARTYKLIVGSILTPIHVRVTDKVLLKKSSKKYLEKTFLSNNNSPIPDYVKKKLVDDLYSVDIQYEKAMKHIDNLYDTKELSFNKYHKNKVTIESLNIKHIFFKFDEFGRMHTNFTTLKKDIRQGFIKYNGEDMCEEDIKNSQPLFLAVLMKNTLPKIQLFNPEFNRYFDLVKNGLIYEEIMDKCNISDRNEVKNMMYRVLFGNNNDIQKYNKNFKKIFPNVYQFIKDFKKEKKDYKVLSHSLQLLESKFVFNNVISHIMKLYPHIPIITIHDSIFYPLRYKKEVKDIFDYHLRKLLEDSSHF